MYRLVISTIGTSLLTNQVKERIDPKDWKECLNGTANYTYEYIDKYEQDVLKIILTLKERAEKQLFDDISDITEIRNISAELNGICGLYDERLELGITDTHILITTDTAQGEIAAKLIESFLKSKNISNVILWVQPELSLASTTVFTESMAKLIPVIQETIQKYKIDKHQICFNLVGGFKALQGYFNTIGMFYADEIVYVFEGSNHQLIKIPKLPIKIDIEKVEKYKVQLAMMAVGEIPAFWEEAKKVPQEWILVIDREMTLSTWGQLIWNQCCQEFLGKQLLPFPRIEYKSTFLDDYRKIENTLDEKIKLQETLAEVALLLHKSKGDTSVLKKHPGLQYDKYTNMKGDIAHFRVNQGIRVSCTSVDGKLFLHRYGREPVVNKNPY